MKSLPLLSACGLALAAAACAPMTPPTARTALDCPTSQGDLKLASVSPDKKTCAYTSRDGDEVSLRLIPVSGSYEAALQPVEQELQAEQMTDQQVAEGKAAAATADAKAIGKAGGASATAASEAAKQAADDALGDMRRAQQDRTRDRGRDHAKDDDDENVSIGMTGVHVSPSGGHGDHADINLPGIHISADDDKANVNMAGVHVDAGEDGATVRMSREVHLRGEGFSPQRRGFRATYILAKDNLKDGWKAVGYEAAGPKVGPITVAVFKAHEGRHHHGSDDVRRLVRRNAGV